MAERAARLTLYIDDAGATADEIEKIGWRSRNAKPVMQNIIKHMSGAQREQFMSEGGRGGRKWQPLTEAWVERKRAHGWHPGIETRLGDLRDSLTVGEAGEFAAEVRHAGKTSATYGSKLFYSRFQGWRRTLLYMTESDMNLYGEMMIDYILSGNV